jgi:hypothetical protein
MMKKIAIFFYLDEYLTPLEISPGDPGKVAFVTYRSSLFLSLKNVSVRVKNILKTKYHMRSMKVPKF